MSGDGIETKVRSYANLVTHGPAVSIPMTEEEWQRFEAEQEAETAKQLEEAQP